MIKKLLTKIKKLKRLSEEDFDSKILQHNIFDYIGISADDFEDLEFLCGDTFLLGKTIKNIMPLSYLDMDWAIDSEGVFDWD